MEPPAPRRWPAVMRAVLVHLLAAAPAVAALGWLDHTLSEGRRVGWERNTVFSAYKRIDANPKATVVQLGSSTSVDWMRPEHLARLLGVPRQEVLDAHLNGCHQDCTHAEVRDLLARGLRFETAFFSTNLFQLCEFAHSKRVLQQHMMLPAKDIPALFAIYLHAERPLHFMGRFLGNVLSGAYGDTAVLQARWRDALYGKAPRGREHRWIRPKAPRGSNDHPCDYAPASVAYKRALTEALLDDLATLAERTYLVLLPEASLSSKDPGVIEAWRRHRALHAEFAEARPHVTLIDLTDPEEGAAHQPKHFRDGFHLNAAGMKLQQALFTRKLDALGLTRARARIPGRR